MQYTAPHYYSKFICSADKCPDTCCAGWQIQIDSSSLKKYKKANGILRNRLQNEINWKEKCFRRYNGRCAFLNDHNLCDLYLDGGGKSAFCRTCRTYPRHIEEYDGLRELSLSLSCPSAAELILTRCEKTHFIHAEKPEQIEPLEKDYKDFDFFLFTKLTDARELIFNILQNRSYPLKVRTAIILALAHDLQERIDRNALYDTDNLFERYASPYVWDWFEKRLKHISDPIHCNITRCQIFRQLFRILHQLEPLRTDWIPYLSSSYSVLMKNNFRCSAPCSNTGLDFPVSDIETEQLLIYFIYTYFCGSVYNRSAYSKMKFAFACTALIRELVCADYLLNADDSHTRRLIRTSYRFSREIEHSDNNKLTLEKELTDKQIFGLENLFTLFC